MMTKRFGMLSDGTEVTACTISGAGGISLTILDYGATIQALRIPDRNGRLVDVVLGYDTIEEYVQGSAYLGATVGRVCNRIGNAAFKLNGKAYTLAKNDGTNHLHGGIRGFDRHMWRMTARDDRIICERLSPDKEEGYPGNLQVRVTFALEEPSTLRIIYDAHTDADTPVSLTNHCYVNLNGFGTVLNHHLQINSDRFCENDPFNLPTGKLLKVDITPFDFRTGKQIGTDIDAQDVQLQRAGGYDHNYCLHDRHAARLIGDQSGIVLDLETDQPGVQLYTANWLSAQTGKNGKPIDRRCAVCLETQCWPNAVNAPGFPSPILRVGVPYHSETIYRFSTL